MTNYIWENFFRKSDQDQEVLEALRQTYIFSALSKKELGFVKDTVHVRNFKAGESIFRQGEVGASGMYVVLKGSLDIFNRSFCSEGDSVRSRKCAVTNGRTRLQVREIFSVSSRWSEHNSRRNGHCHSPAKKAC